MQTKNKLNKKAKLGFTLIELLIVIAIIGIIAGVVFVALDPGKRFSEARNSTRWSDVGEIMNAVKVNQVDNKGPYLASIAALTDWTYYEIGTCAAGAAACTAHAAADCVNLTGLVTAGYLGKVPMDPSSGSAANTDYYLKKDATGIITVGACAAESGAVIEVVR